MRCTSALLVALVTACSSDRIADQSSEELALLCNEHPVAAGYYCPDPDGKPVCHRAVAHSCREQLAQATDDCTVTIDDFIACAEARPCPVANTQECGWLAACGINLRELTFEACP